MPNPNLRTKLIVTLSTVLLLSFILTSLLSYFVSRQTIRSSALDETLPLISNNIFSEIQHDLMRPIHVSSLMANDAFLKKWAMDGEHNISLLVKYLDDIKEKYGFFTSFYVSELTSNYYYYRGILKQIDPADDHDQWYYRFKKLDAPYDLDVDTDEASAGTLTVFINHRLEDYQGRLLGVTGVGLKMSKIGEILKSYQQTYHRTVYLVDGKGLVQVHPDPAKVERADLAHLVGDKALAERILAHHQGTHAFEFDHHGHHVLLSSRYIPDFKWFLIVEIDDADSLGEIRTAVFSNLAIGLVATALILLITVVAVNSYQKRLEIMATTDDLTQVANRRDFMDRLGREVKRAIRYQHPVSLMMIDADHFKAVNDRFGHAVGDDALRALAAAIRDTVRDSDQVGRVGGEEFAVLLPQTGSGEAQTVADRIHRATADLNLTVDGQAVRITVSLGLVSGSGSGMTAEKLLQGADQAMYQAKQAGRNQVFVGPNLTD